MPKTKIGVGTYVACFEQMEYAKHLDIESGSTNNAGGQSFTVDDWRRLDRFLILGNEGGSYYVSERNLTQQNASCIIRLLKEGGPQVVERIVEMSGTGRIIKNDTAIFALALCARLGDEATRKAVYAAVPKVCRTGTHLFHFIRDCQAIRKGWSRGLRNAVVAWYSSKNANTLAYQLVKYQSRDGWSNADLLRLSHPKAKHVDQQAALGGRRSGRPFYTQEHQARQQNSSSRNTPLRSLAEDLGGV